MDNVPYPQLLSGQELQYVPWGVLLVRPIGHPPGRCHHGPLTNGPLRIPPYCVSSGGADTVTGGGPKLLRPGPLRASPFGVSCPDPPPPPLRRLLSLRPVPLCTPRLAPLRSCRGPSASLPGSHYVRGLVLLCSPSLSSARYTTDSGVGCGRGCACVRGTHDMQGAQQQA